MALKLTVPSEFAACGSASGDTLIWSRLGPCTSRTICSTVFVGGATGIGEVFFASCSSSSHILSVAEPPVPVPARPGEKDSPLSWASSGGSSTTSSIAFRKVCFKLIRGCLSSALTARNPCDHLLVRSQFFQGGRHRIGGDDDLLDVGENLLRGAGANL